MFYRGRPFTARQGEKHQVSGELNAPELRG